MAAQQDDSVSGAEPKPQGAIFIVSIVGLLTLAIWASVFALTFIRG